MLLTLLFGFSSGMPLLLIGGTLKVWLTREGVDIKQIGYYSWVGLAYSFKFLWAPLLDRWVLLGLGRRRSWILFGQLGSALLIAYLGFLDPKTSLGFMALVCVMIGIFSATQDMAVDALRRESLADEEMGVGSTLYQYGYRLAMLVTGGLAVGLVGLQPESLGLGGSSWNITWTEVYLLMGFLLGLCTLATFFVPEPEIDPSAVPKTLRNAVIDPFKDFWSRPLGVWILLFVFSFKLGDAISGSMLSAFYVQMGYTNQDIAVIAKTYGLISSLVGALLGGSILYYIGTKSALWIFGILQAVSTAAFAVIPMLGPEKWALASVVIFEDLTSAMGTSAFLAFISMTTNKRYTSTQFALLSSLAGVGRNVLSGFAGHFVAALGWSVFFVSCAFVAIPGLILLWKLSRLGSPELSKPKV